MTFRPALRPGAALLRRDATTLQIGTSPGIVVADRPGLVPLLHLVNGSRDVARIRSLMHTEAPGLDVDTVLRELRALGVVFDASRWSTPPRRGLDAEARHLDLRGDDPSRLSVRPTFRVAFHTDTASRAVVDAARGILTASGIGRTDPVEPDLLVVASCGEPSRVVFERAMAAGLDHLPVVVDEDRVRIGPLVRPGVTPCVSCHDLHRGDWDRAWPALLPQLGRHTGVLTPPGLSALTAHAAAVELAAEVLAHCDGTPVRTTGRLLAVGPGHDERASWPLAFHHACTCDLLSAA